MDNEVQALDLLFSQDTTVFNRIRDGLVAVEADGTIATVNRSFAAMGFGSSASLRGRPFTEVFVDTQLRNAVEEALQGREVAPFDIEVRKSASECLLLTVQCVPLTPRPEQECCAVLIFQDGIALAEIDRLKSDFVSMVSHEIRSPMNSLLAQIQLILDGLAGEVSEKQREILELASDKVYSMVTLVSELLDLARIEAGMLGREMEMVDLSEILEEQVAFHRARAKEKDIELSLHCEEMPPLRASRLGLEQVVTNLVSNGMNYSPRGAQVLVTANRQDNSVLLQVSDSGFGMSEEEQKHLFERFYRVRNEKTRDIQGTGLGLAIVKSIVEAHGGKVLVQSREGKGSVFTVILPEKE